MNTRALLNAARAAMAEERASRTEEQERREAFRRSAARVASERLCDLMQMWHGRAARREARQS